MRLCCQDSLVPGRSLEERLDRLESWGFEGVETSINEQNAERVKEVFAGRSVKPSVVGVPVLALFTSPDRKVREETFEVTKRYLEIAEEVGVVGAAMVPELSRPPLPDLTPYKSKMELEFELFCVYLKQVDDYARKCGVYIILENVNRYEIPFFNRLEQITEVAKRVGCTNTGILADTFHMNIEESNIEGALAQAAGYVKHVHLVDSNRMLPGYGHTDFLPILRVLKDAGYTGFMSFEGTVPGDPEVTIPAAAERVRQWMARLEEGGRG